MAKHFSFLACLCAAVLQLGLAAPQVPALKDDTCSVLREDQCFGEQLKCRNLNINAQYLSVATE